MGKLPIFRATLERLAIEDRIDCSECGLRDAVFEIEVWRVDQNPMHDNPEHQNLCDLCTISLILKSVPVDRLKFEKRGEVVDMFPFAEPNEFI